MLLFYVLLLSFILSLGLHTIIKINTLSTTEDEEPKDDLQITPSERMEWELCQEQLDIELKPCFTAEQIMLFYNTAPTKWKRIVFSIYYMPAGRFADKNTTIINFPNMEEYVKTMRFFKRQEDLMKQQEQIQNTLKILPYLQEDARKAQVEADRAMAECEGKIQNIYNNIRKECGYPLER